MLNAVLTKIQYEDGSNRDIVFEPIKKELVPIIFMQLYKHYIIEYVSYNSDIINDEELKIKFMKNDFSLFNINEGYIALHWFSKNQVISLFHMLIDWDNNNLYIECSFAPRDTVFNIFNLRLFLDYLLDLSNKLNCNGYYIKFEDSCWKKYNDNDASVILSKKKYEDFLNLTNASS